VFNITEPLIKKDDKEKGKEKEKEKLRDPNRGWY
jgi:hypothetical protein